MAVADLTEDPKSGLFIGAGGRRYIWCDFDPRNPQWIDISGTCWEATYAGQKHVLDWEALALPDALSGPLQQIVSERLKTHAPSYLSRVFGVLCCLRDAASRDCDLTRAFASITPSAWRRLWKRLNSDARSTIRSLFVEMATRGMAGADYLVARELQGWRARVDVETLRPVLTWDSARGSLTTAEAHLVLSELKQDVLNEPDGRCAIRLYGWILFETLKRPIQLLSMKRNALRSIRHADGMPAEYFLLVPKAKCQAGGEPDWWQITEALGHEIEAYSERAAVRSLQLRFDRLIVLPDDDSWNKFGQISTHVATARLREQLRHITSPRTKRPLNVTPNRVRHTGATAMAMHGASRDEIQDNLEHDSPFSAQAYIDAVGAELLPLLERTDRGIGEVFSELNHAFFRGLIVGGVGPRPISIPVVVEAPAVVGSCGKHGVCSRHPFFACYDGCSQFLAWRDADHQRALAFVEAERNRWGRAEGHRERTKLTRDFDRVAASIVEVIDQIGRAHAEPSDHE
jgi:hypothetical protein